MGPVVAQRRRRHQSAIQQGNNNECNTALGRGGETKHLTCIHVQNAAYHDNFLAAGRESPEMSNWKTGASIGLHCASPAGSNVKQLSGGHVDRGTCSQQRVEIFAVKCKIVDYPSVGTIDSGVLEGREEEESN